MTLPVTDGFSSRIQAEVDFTNEWVTKYRVPVVTDMYAGVSFIAQLVTPRNGEYSNLFQFLAPDKADAVLVGKYIAYRKTALAAWYVSKMEERSLDIDGGGNTVTFGKREHGWVYNHASWQDQPFFPYQDDAVQFPTLLDIINKERSYSGVIDPKWLKFLEEN